MKQALMIAVTGVALAATLSLVAAGASKRIPETGALSANDILGNVRALGLDPIGEPARRGFYYVLHAYDPNRIEVRVVADASFGDILSVMPTHALNTAYAPRYVREPRIIQVPQPGNDRASVNERDENTEPLAITSDDIEEPGLPPDRAKSKPRSVTAPKSQRRRSEAPPSPPLGPPRTVLSAPPPPAEGPTPLHPTPRYNSNGDNSDKFGAPGDATAASSAPRDE